MTEEVAYHYITWGFLALGAVTFVALFFVTAPYGRHAAKSRLPTIDATLGWVLMESPSALVPIACWFWSEHRTDPGRLALLALWELHYLHRTYVFPFRRRGGERRMPISIPASAFAFTSVNAYLNGRWLFTFAPAGAYGATWLADPRFLAGAALFLAGFAINQQSDAILFNLRKPGETGYKVPQGGLYRFVSCPNYFGEIVEWTGWAIASWSFAGLVFAIWTVANLLPRAVSHHRWYKDKFADYPAERRALIPFVL
jgi:steroid 5-alpha-reductase/3-oxo-5-alpha-steroid 4-dehydrogenase 1